MASLFIKVINMSITASWLILAVIFLRALFRKSPRWMMVILWGLVGLRLILPVSVESEYSLIPSVGLVEESQTVEDGSENSLPDGISSLTYISAAATKSLTGDETVGNEDESDRNKDKTTDNESGMGGNGNETDENGNETGEDVSGTDLKSATGLRATVSDLLTTVSGFLSDGWNAMVGFLQIHSGSMSVIWLFGAVAVLLYMAVNCILLRVRLKTAVRLEESTCQSESGISPARDGATSRKNIGQSISDISAAGERSRSRKNIYQSEYITSPFLLGLLRPRIYLPFSLEEEDMPYVIAHERAHMARGDHFVKTAGFVLVAVHWFNPLVWLAYSFLCRDIEMACDERVVRSMDAGSIADYAEALLRCEMPRSGAAARAALSFGRVCVKKRVRHVLYYKKPAWRAVAMAVAVCMILSAGFLINPVPVAVSAGEETGDSVSVTLSASGYSTAYLEEELTETISVSAEVPAASVYEGDFGLYRYTRNVSAMDNELDPAVIQATERLAAAVDRVMGTDYEKQFLSGETDEILAAMNFVISWTGKYHWFYTTTDYPEGTYTDQLAAYFPFRTVWYDESQVSGIAEKVAESFSEFLLYSDYTWECVAVGGELYECMEEFYENYGLVMPYDGVAGVTAETPDSYEIVLRPVLDHGLNYQTISNRAMSSNNCLIVYLNADYGIQRICGINYVLPEEEAFETVKILPLSDILEKFSENYSSKSQATVVKAELCYTEWTDSVRGEYLAPCWVITYAEEKETALQQWVYCAVEE